MRIKLLIIMILPVLLLECKTSFWTVITKKNSTLISETEKAIVDEAAASIDFSYGFDPDLEMDYVFKAGKFTDAEINAKSPEMKKVLLKFSSTEIISFYEKMVQVKETQIWKMKKFRERENWVNATYIEKYTLPDTSQFLDILEKNVIQINTVYGADIESRKNVIRKTVTRNLQKEYDYKAKKLKELQEATNSIWH